VMESFSVEKLQSNWRCMSLLSDEIVFACLWCHDALKRRECILTVLYVL